MRAPRYVLLSLLLSLAASCGGDDGNGGDVITPKAICSDGIDNDGDGKIDFPDDDGCLSASADTESSPPLPACSDGRDNDGDGKADYPNDPGCFAPQADSEVDDCPTGPNCPQCGNGKDDDMNGSVDYPTDPGCESAADTSEFINNPLACGPNLKVVQLPGDGIVMATTDAMSTTSLPSDCTTGAGAPALAYVFQLTDSRVVVASTDDDATDFDTVLSIRPAMCLDPAVACNDDSTDANAVTTKGSKLTASLAAGTYYLIVQGYDASKSGTFHLTVNRFAGEGATCAVVGDCGPGLVCRIPHAQTAMVCAKPVCSDGLDDDGDAKIDYPADPGCASVTDDTETDDCPSGPNCPQCADGIDNDADGQIDYPNDVTCAAASNTTESCVATEGVPALTMPTTTGNLTAATNDLPLYCTSGAGGKDLTYSLQLPATTTLTITTSGVDTVNSLLPASCSTPTLNCTDDPALTQTNLPAGTYYYVADAWSSAGSGTISVTVAGSIANGASCESPLAQSGALTCGTGYACAGATGSRVCAPAQCANGIDDNGNGRMDFPADPGCDSPSDNTETTVCPGSMCPVCSDGVDNDMDGQTDFPLDVACRAASGTSESCSATEGVTALTMPSTMGNLTAATNDVPLYCTMGSNGKDLTYSLQLPATTSLTITTTGVDTVNSLLSATCTTPTLGCVNTNALTLTNLAAGTYFYVADAYSSTGSGTITVAPESSNRSTIASAANPPNTTLCTAPIRAQASIATAASGTIGM